jgi:hypothetical protein
MLNTDIVHCECSLVVSVMIDTDIVPCGWSLCQLC